MRDQKRDAILRMALKLFLEQGYHRTVLTEIATRLSITKPALYNYCDGKEEILIECFRVGQDMYETHVAAMDTADGDGLARLRKRIRAYVKVIASDFGVCVTRLDDRELSPRVRATVRAAKRRINAVFHDLIVEGIADGSIKACDPRLTTFMIISALNGIGDWYRPDGPLSIDAIIDEYVLRLTEGIAAG